VRHSLVDPHAYTDSNLTGFINILEGCRHTGWSASAVRVVVVGLRREHARAVPNHRQCRFIRSVSTARPRRQTS